MVLATVAHCQTSKTDRLRANALSAGFAPPASESAIPHLITAFNAPAPIKAKSKTKPHGDWTDCVAQGGRTGGLDALRGRGSRLSERN